MFDYLASVIVVADGFEDWAKVVGCMREALAGMPDVLVGISLLSANGYAVRTLAHSAPAMNAATTELWSLARELVFGLPRFEQRKY
jgi:urease accessory protein UreH